MCFCVVRTCFVSAETVVAESVVVIKKLLQTQPTQHSEIIKHMAKLFDNITVRLISVLFVLLTCLHVFNMKVKTETDEVFKITIYLLSPTLLGSHGPSKHPVADGRVLREGTKDCT